MFKVKVNRNYTKMIASFIAIVILVTVSLPLTAFAAQANYDGTFINCPYGEFQVAQVQFTGKYLSLSAAAMPGTVSGATSVTVTIKKKDWLGIFNTVVATRNIPLDGIGYAIAVGPQYLQISQCKFL